MDFSWIAYYKDGTKLCQFEDEKENKYTDIRRKELLAFALCQVNTGVPQVTIYFDRPTQRLILRQRIQNELSLSNGTLTQTAKIWMIGWQELVNGRNYQCLFFLYEDGTVCAMPRFRKEVDFTFRDFKLEDKLDGIGEKKS